MTVSDAPARGWTAADSERYLTSLELFGMQFGLERMRALLELLDEPQQVGELEHGDAVVGQ